MPFEEGVDLAVRGLPRLAVVAHVDDVDVLIEFDLFEADKVVFVVGVAMTDEGPRGQRRSILET